MVVATVAAAVVGGVGVGLFVLAGVTYRRWDRPGTGALVVFLALLGAAALSAVVLERVVEASIQQESPPPTVETLFYGHQTVVSTALFAWTVFVFRYTGYGEVVVRTRARILALWAPLMGTFLALAGQSYLSGGTEPAGGLAALLDSLLTPLVTFSYLFWLFVVGAGLIALFRTTYRYDYLGTAQGLSLAGPALTVLLSNAGLNRFFGTRLWLLGVAGSYLVSATAVALGLFRYDALDSRPAAATIGRGEVLDDLDDVVVVVDRDGVIVDLNPAARREFGLDDDELLDEPLSELLGIGLDALPDGDAVEVTTSSGRRRFDSQVSALTGPQGEPVGYAVTLRDVTGRAIREQRLAVLNRVLRHNLRNKLTVVRGVAEVAVDGGRPPEPMAESLSEATDDLIEIGEKAREIERLLGEERAGPVAVDVGSVAAAVADRHRERFPGVEFETDLSGELTVGSDRELLEFVLSNVVENAAEHNDDDPRVRVTADRDGDDPYPVRVRVSDNGPGIPDHERTVIEAGEETPLEHGSGLGLWATAWGVRRLGGRIDFPDAGEGTTVELRLPDRDPAEVDSLPTAVGRGRDRGQG